MQFAEILPFLDAEIDRLQKARDLLAYVPTSDGIDTVEERMSSSVIHAEPQTTLKLATPRKLAATAASLRGVQQAVQSLQAEQSRQADQADQTNQTDPQAAATIDIEPAAPRIERMPYKARRERRTAPGRHKPTLAQHADMALRSSVPAGPVVVSAEEVRKVQAIRAEAARSTPIPVEPGQFYGWRDRASELRSAEALLQRWITGAVVE